MKRIVVGVNDPSGSDELVAWTTLLARELHSAVRIVHAVHRSELWVVAGLQLDCTAYVRDYRRRLVHYVLAPLAARGVTASVQISFGDPARTLADAVRQSDAGLILIGASGHTPMIEMFAGSVAHRLEHLVSVPLVVVPMSCPIAA